VSWAHKYNCESHLNRHVKNLKLEKHNERMMNAVLVSKALEEEKATEGICPTPQRTLQKEQRAFRYHVASVFMQSATPLATLGQPEFNAMVESSGEWSTGGPSSISEFIPGNTNSPS
jgi:hypothetical protein